MDRKKYKDVAEMIADVSSGEEFAREAQEHIDKRFIVHRLYGTRSAKGVSQQEMAERLNCSQSRISKLENSEDEDLRLGDLKKYLAAIGMNLTVFISKKQWRAIDQIKFHAFRIRHILEDLTKLAKDDPEIAKGVHHCHLETLFNLVKLVSESAQGLPDFPQIMPPLIEANGAERDTSTSSMSSVSSASLSTKPVQTNTEAVPAA